MEGECKSEVDLVGEVPIIRRFHESARRDGTERGQNSFTGAELKPIQTNSITSERHIRKAVPYFTDYTKTMVTNTALTKTNRKKR